MIQETEKTVSVPAKKKRRKPKRRFIPGWVIAVMVIIAAAFLISSLIFPLLQISGDSMEPGFNDGDIVVLTRTKSFKAGDLICFNWNKQTLFKRVIACPGDWVTIDGNGRVYVNGKLLDEPYVSEFEFGDKNDIKYPYQVPEESYFVLGDERKTSVDSRNSHVGCIGYDRIVGKGALRIWPIAK